MKFLISSEVYKEVGEKVRRVFHLSMEKLIKENFLNKSYGGGIETWGYIPIVMPADLLPQQFFQEIKKYRKNKKEVEFRLKIDYDKFLTAGEREVSKMIAESMLRSVDIAEAEFGIKDFDFASFRNDLKSYFKEKGWI